MTVDREEAGVPAGAGTAAEDLLGELASSLRRHVAGRRRAEERLADFAFREGSGPSAVLGPADWRYFLARSLGEALDPSGLRLLDLVRHGPRSLRQLSEPIEAPDLVAAADRVGRLAVAGLVSRDLETGQVTLEPLGAAVLALLDEVERRAAEPGR